MAKHKFDFSLNIDEMSNKTKSEQDDLDIDYAKDILGKDYDEIVKNTVREFQLSTNEVNKTSEEGSSTLSTVKVEKFGTDSDSSTAFDSLVEKLLIEEKRLTSKFKFGSGSGVSDKMTIESSSESAKSIVSYKTNQLGADGGLGDQTNVLEELLIKLKEKQEAEEKQFSVTKEEAQLKSPKTAKVQENTPELITNTPKQAKIPVASSKPSKVIETQSKPPIVVEERSESSKLIEQCQKPSNFTEIQSNLLKIPEQPNQLVEPAQVLQETKTQDIHQESSNEEIRMKLTNFIETTETILTQVENTGQNLTTSQTLQKRTSLENSSKNVTVFKNTDKVEGQNEHLNRAYSQKSAESRQSSKSAFSRSSSIDSPRQIRAKDTILNKPIDESKVEEVFNINEKLLNRMLEENKMMAMKIEQNRFQDDKSIQLSFPEEYIESTLTDDITLSKKLSCTVIKPITKRFKRKNLSFSDAQVRKIEYENKYLESRIRDLMKKGSGLSNNPSAKYSIEASSSINRRKFDAQTCRDNLKIEKKIRDIKKKTNQKAPWAVPVWI